MNNNFLISVILPCYNVSQFIDRCMQSIVKQTIGVNNLEIICVNDASTDDTLDKLYKWEKEYPNNIMVVTYEENQRQGAARNIGMRYAGAEFLTFVDSDDWIEEDMLKDMYHRMISGDYDMVACKYIRDSGDGIPNMTEQNDKEYTFEEINGFCWADVSDSGCNGIYGGVYTKLFKREWLIANEMWFPEGLSYEDNYWIGMLILYLRKIYIIDKIYYHYWVNLNSTVTAHNSNRHFDRIVVEEMLINKYSDIGVLSIYRNDIFANFIMRYYLNTMFILFSRFDVVPTGIYERIREFVFLYFEREIKQLASVVRTGRMGILLQFLVTNEEASDKSLKELKIRYFNN